MRLHPSVPLLGIVIAGVLSAACESNPAAVETSGAIIEGTVASDSVGSNAEVSAQSNSDAAKGLRVSVEGTELSVMVSENGRFRLTGVPDGNVTLRFEGSGVNAQLTIGGLVEGQTMTITVAVTASTARLISTVGLGPGNTNGPSVEFTGRVSSLTPPTLMVGNRAVLTNPSTQFKGAGTRSLLDLKVGNTVRVAGASLPDGSVLAHEIARLN